MRNGCLAIAAFLVILPAACGEDDADSAAPRLKSTSDVIRETEEQRLHALVVRDIATARTLHAEDFMLTTPRGTLSKNEYLKAVESGRLDYVVFEPVSPIRVVVAGTRATLRYRSKIGFAGNFGGTTEQSHVDTYELQDGRWQIVRSIASSGSIRSHFQSPAADLPELART
jgi:Domain of unknown function (DUF4440)